MWIQRDLVAQVEAVVTIRYVNVHDCALWNEHRREGEMRLFTGWSWTARHGNEHQQGLKTHSAAVRDAYYRMVLKAELPTKRRHLRVAA
jgi:hypothetical protein